MRSMKNIVVCCPVKKAFCKGYKTYILDTVKPVLKGHSNIDKAKILMTNGSLMKVES